MYNFKYKYKYKYDATQKWSNTNRMPAQSKYEGKTHFWTAVFPHKWFTGGEQANHKGAVLQSQQPNKFQVLVFGANQETQQIPSPRKSDLTFGCRPNWGYLSEEILLNALCLKLIVDKDTNIFSDIDYMRWCRYLHWFFENIFSDIDMWKTRGLPVQALEEGGWSSSGVSSPTPLPSGLTPVSANSHLGWKGGCSWVTSPAPG